MDRRHGLTVALLLAVSCGPSSPALRPLSPGDAPSSAARGLRIKTRAASGVLTYAVALDHTRRRLVTVELATAFELIIRDLDPGGAITATRRLALGAAEYDIDDLALSADGTTAWVASADGTVRGIDLDRLAISATWNLGDSASAVVATPDGSWIATGSRSGVLCLRRASDDALLQCVAAHGGPISALATRGDRLVSASWDGTVTAWSLPALAIVGRHEVAGSANDVSMSPGGARVAIAVSRAPPVRSPAAVDRERAESFRAADPGAYIEIWSPDAEPLQIRGHGAPITAIAWTPDGERLLSGSWDRTVRLWDSRTGNEIDRLDGLSHIVRDVVVAPDGRWVALGAWAVSDGHPSSVLAELLYTAE